MTRAVRIYHNPRCSKSREALAWLRERGLEPEIVLYLEGKLGAAELKSLLAQVGGSPHDAVRRKEEAYLHSGLSEESTLDEVAQAIEKAPVLLERPVVVLGDRAVIARPTTKLVALLSGE